MKIKTLKNIVFAALLGSVISCSGDSVEPETADEELFDSTEYSSGEDDTKKPKPKRQYDLSILSKECLDMLDKYEEMQAKIKDASNAAKMNRADQELQDAYYLLLSENTKLLSDQKMVDCSNEVTFQYAMVDIQDKYYD